MDIEKQNNFEELIHDVYQTHCLLQQNVQKAINLNLTIRNWLIGCYIVEFEQNGEDRAKYGIRLLEEMAKTLKIKGVKGVNSRALRNCRLFYVFYPQIWRSVTAKLQRVDFSKIKSTRTEDFPICRPLTAKLQTIEIHENTIRGSVTPELEEDCRIRRCWKNLSEENWEN